MRIFHSPAAAAHCVFVFIFHPCRFKIIYALSISIEALFIALGLPFCVLDDATMNIIGKNGTAGKKQVQLYAAL